MRRKPYITRKSKTVPEANPIIKEFLGDIRQMESNEW